MSDKYTYYTQESMKEKRVSDLKSDPAFLTDALSFLRSDRKGFNEKDIATMSSDDVVDEVLEHFRYQTVNETTMAKDYYYLNDPTTKQEDRESFGRLMFAFDNAKGEGLFDRGAEKIKDYAGGLASAPSTIASVGAGLFTAGAGAAAIQGGKAAALAALRKAGGSALRKSLVAGAVDGSIAAASEYGVQKMREDVAPDIGEDYDVSAAQVALSGVLGGSLGAAGYAVPALRQNKAAEGLVDVVAKGDKAKLKRTAVALADAKKTAAAAKGTEKGRKLLKYTTDTLLRSIDPRLVEEGKVVKYDLFSSELPDGLLGGLDTDLIQRMSAASFELAQRAGIEPDKGQRITEFLANNIEEGSDIFEEIRTRFGLTPRQLSAVYAAEVSEAARLLGSQANYTVNKGRKTLTKAETKAHMEKIGNDIDTLYEKGLSTIKADDIVAIEDANKSIASKTYRTLKGFEDGRRMFMTSQPATTMRNNIFSVAMTGIDMMDQLSMSVVRSIRKNPEATAGSTVDGTFDTFKYLTRDPYVAEALTLRLKQEAPDKMQKVFYDAAMAEANTVKDSKFAKVGAAANILNTMSDHVFKRAVIAGTIDRELKALGDDAIGTSVMDMLEKGTIDLLPNDILDKALDESLAFTFQRKFGGKEASAESKAAKMAIDTIHNYGLTTLIPFPRYLASQAKFISDYTGLTAVRRVATGKSIADKEIAKFMTGGALAFGAYYGIAKEKIEKGLEWNYLEGTDNQVYDATAAYGPMALHMYVADLVARAAQGYEVKPTAAVLEDLNSILIGTEFRPGSGITSDVARAIDAGNLEPLVNTLTDYVGSYTYPAAVVKDFYGQFDPRSSYLPEIRDATVNTMDIYGPDFPMSVYQRATRHLPDFNIEEMAKEAGLENTFVESMLNSFSTSTYTTYQEKYAAMKDIPTEGYDSIRFDVFGDGPLKMRDPFLKQITGFTGRPPRNELQREMSRLQLDPFKVYNPYRERNTALEVYTQQKLQGNLAPRVEEWMQGPNYTALTNSAEKRNALDRKIKDEITVARKEAEKELKYFSSRSPEEQKDFDSYVRGEMRSLTGKNREDAELGWARINDRLGYSNMSIDESVEAIRNEEGLTEREREVKETQLYLTFIQQAPNYRRFEGEVLQ